MSSLNQYFDGVVRVPLRLLTTDGFAECPSLFSNEAAVTHFEQFLSNKNAPITGVITPEQMLEMLRAMGITLSYFRESTNTLSVPLLNETVTIGCLVGEECLAKARLKLSPDFECLVNIYCIPTDIPGQYSNGQVLRQILLNFEDSNLSSKWLARLTEGMQRHVRMLMDRPRIWSAMRRVSLFPGLWEDVQIGNFAKHLAAHMDEAFEHYWNRMAAIWSSFFKGLEAQIPMLEARDVQFLQYKAPKECIADKKSIFESLDNKRLFSNIHNENDRALLYRNLTQHDVIIPSILSFHENIKYVTIGIKIIEREILPAARSLGGDNLNKQSKSFLPRLQQHWNPQAPQTAASTARKSSLILLAVALASFHILSNETPLQDVKGCALLSGPCGHHINRLRKLAVNLGFVTNRITQGLRMEHQCTSHPVPRARTPTNWRGGKPTISVYLDLQSMSSLALEPHNSLPLQCNTSWVFNDIISAFFGEAIMLRESTEPNPTRVSSENDCPVGLAPQIEMPDLALDEPMQRKQLKKARKRHAGAKPKKLVVEGKVKKLRNARLKNTKLRGKFAQLNPASRPAETSDIPLRNSRRSIPTLPPSPSMIQDSVIHSGNEARLKRKRQSIELAYEGNEHELRLKRNRSYVSADGGNEDELRLFEEESDAIPDRDQDDQRSNPAEEEL